ncbi:GxxExxY protein [Cognataquiflexum rubidum]|uniref:GxxExxY protein n=1 Tax=Cognataquiflexum rubidum TaxID=2922273 RepID=UPI001F13D924|nr:GxxExxY protein [Cognataquiflexum rubidum]MCH6233765.1 GxxExxY protein [Cognataquiflexum rubidum]
MLFLVMHENEISYLVRGAIFQVFKKLGPGLLESIYELALEYELRKKGLKVERQVFLPILYDEELLGQYRLDLLVEDKVIIEVKSVFELSAIHHKQLLTYLKLSQKKLGILVNFNEAEIENGIFRKVMDL